MHINQAKIQIRNAIAAYSAKDERGKPRIPVQAQRPVFLVGAPGIGKTAIVEQIAEEMDLGFVSYSMTHHTRQSALGLPYIVEKEYGGKKYSVSEYTMSEILASVYDEMEKTGKQTGILFLDEINCVSETLAPSMLQFLQYKTFGRHCVPEGWIVVTAGNPAEYNDSVREFDIAMLDRLKKIEVEPDFEVWKEFAVKSGVHPSVLSYLSIKPQNFYRVSTTLDGKSFVTARSWDDLSKMIAIYEENGIETDRNLISQYLQDEAICTDFSNYYDLYRKYQSDYQVEEILSGTVSEEIIKRAGNAKFDERLSLISLVLSSLEDQVKETLRFEDGMKNVIREMKGKSAPFRETIAENTVRWNRQAMETASAAEVETALATEKIYAGLEKALDQNDSREVLKKELAERLDSLKKMNTEAGNSLENVFVFMEKAFDKGQEMLILVSELTIRPDIARYIYTHGCEKYYQYNDKLLFEDQKGSLNERIDALNLLALDQD
ncbi:MAG: AAA family ATPase [Solobacterium sp.]|nr:AAA family ATPase [Solobacterium sp.]